MLGIQQRLALRWVYDNIEKFGGDRTKITIAGESAGAASVHYLMMDNSTRKFYKRAILQSGTLLNPTANQIQPLHVSFNYCYYSIINFRFNYSYFYIVSRVQKMDKIISDSCNTNSLHAKSYRLLNYY